jgi:hypothetical protein
MMSPIFGKHMTKQLRFGRIFPMQRLRQPVGLHLRKNAKRITYGCHQLYKQQIKDAHSSDEE